MDLVLRQERPENAAIGFGYFRLRLNSKGVAEDCIFIDINNEFEILTGLKKREVLGKGTSEVSGMDKYLNFDWLTYCERAVRAKKTREITQWIEPVDKYYKITLIPSYAENFGVVVQEAYSPDSSYIQGDEPIFEGLEDIFNSTHDAMLLIEYRNGQYKYLNNNALHKKLTGFFDIMGCTPAELLGEILGRKLTKYYDRCIDTGRPVEYEQHYDFASGRRIWQTEITQLSERSGAVYLLSSSKDITEFRAIQDENNLLIQRLKSMFSRHSAIMLIIEPFSGRISDANPAACNFYGYTREEITKMYISDINMMSAEEVEKRRMLSYEGVQNSFIFSHRLKNGDVRTVDVYSCPISDGDNSMLYSIIFDVTDRENYRSALLQEKEALRTTLHRIKFLSYYDYLTGLFNRRYMEEVIVRMDNEENLPISVVMGDVNGLKIINNVFGHETGDTILKYLARSLKRNCSKKCTISRWGGDEMLIIMPNTELDAAEEVVQNIKRDYINSDETGLHLSISFGCAVKMSAGESMQEVIRESEECMYHQKLLDGKSNRNAIINTLLAMLYEKSNETEEHSKRLDGYCHLIGRALKLSSKEMDELSLLAILHDIGKVSIDPDILKKPGSLTESEWEEMKRHAEIGCRVAQATPELAMIADLILSHHERWDGKGYPRGLKEEEIPLPCRILAVADAFDAMTNDRIYRKSLGVSEAIREIEKNVGTQFDPLIAKIFIEHVAKDDR